MTARFWSWLASEPAKARTLTAAVAPRIVEAAGIALGRLFAMAFIDKVARET
jgi:hypothetical protein